MATELVYCSNVQGKAYNIVFNDDIFDIFIFTYLFIIGEAKELPLDIHQVLSEETHSS